MNEFRGRQIKDQLYSLMKYLRIDELEFITDDGMVFGPVGGGGGSPFVSSHPGNHLII